MPKGGTPRGGRGRHILQGPDHTHRERAGGSMPKGGEPRQVGREGGEGLGGISSSVKGRGDRGLAFMVRHPKRPVFFTGMSPFELGFVCTGIVRFRVGRECVLSCSIDAHPSSPISHDVPLNPAATDLQGLN